LVEGNDIMRSFTGQQWKKYRTRLNTLENNTEK
jgi:hypothetical protein